MVSDWHKKDDSALRKDARLAKKSSARHPSWDKSTPIVRNIAQVEALLPYFIKWLDDYSPTVAASRAGFRWNEWRNTILKNVAVNAAYEQYLARLKKGRT